MIRVALAQMNPTVGDLDGNVGMCADAIEKARELGAQVVALPELAITGYPPEDLLLKRSFVSANRIALERLAAQTQDLLCFVGFVDRGPEAIYNAAAICHGGRVVDIYRKHLLPNYGVFDERRYFDPGKGHVLVDTEQGVIGVCVCEDVWGERGPVISQGDAGAQIVVNINASPFHKGKVREREELLCTRARRAHASIVYVNAVGGQDELVFDGGSLVVDPQGEILARLPQFEETLAVVDVPLGDSSSGGDGDDVAIRRARVQLRARSGDSPPVTRVQMLSREAEVYQALTLGLRDYAHKNGFSKAVIGLSGGVDSALTAAIAADALGPDSVLGISMPSEFSSDHSITDAKELAANLGIEYLEIPIKDAYKAYLKALSGAFGKTDMGLAEENIQARIRGNLLMAASNRYGHLVIATGNKSEMACGYATLYGDMAGGLALLKDVFKTEVYALCRHRNESSPVIPENVLSKPPSAELRPGQKDSDSLPPYEDLDPILEAYIEDDASIADIVASGKERELVERVIALVDRAEYKRRQAPPGPKVTTKAFGRDRRLPITNAWRESESEDLPSRSVGPDS